MSDSPVIGVSACLFRAGQVLLIERRDPPFQGLLSLPGGKVGLGERLDAAVAREVREETGLAIDRFAFFCLHEIVEPGVHAVIAVYRAVEAIRPGIEPVAADDAASLAFTDIAALGEMSDAGRLTAGLREIVVDAHRAHQLGL